jgi:hypothetical protein
VRSKFAELIGPSWGALMKLRFVLFRKKISNLLLSALQRVVVRLLLIFFVQGLFTSV